MATSESATTPQLDYIGDLIRDRDTDRLRPEQREWLENQFGHRTLNRGEASRIIEALLALPKVTKQQEARTQGGPHGVPNGRYAVTEADDVLRFYKVNSPVEGKWVGWTFVDVQASDALYPVKDRARRSRIIALIAADVQGAMLRYGRELGCCGHCGRTLTNELSRELGIGPICREKMGW